MEIKFVDLQGFSDFLQSPSNDSGRQPFVPHGERLVCFVQHG
jgi:hypothetical protein